MLTLLEVAVACILIVTFPLIVGITLNAMPDMQFCNSVFPSLGVISIIFYDNTTAFRAIVYHSNPSFLKTRSQ